MALDPETISLIARTGGSFLSNFFDPEEPGAGVRRAGIRELGALSGRPVINLDAAIARNRALQRPRIRRLGESVNRRFKFDTGRAQKALSLGQLEGERRFNLGAGIQADRLKSQRDFDIALARSRFRG